MTTPHDGIQSGSQQHGIQHGHHDDGHGHTPLVLPYSDADIAEFRRDDVHAGTMIVGLMAGIFMVGVVLYTLVVLTVGPGVPS